MKAKDVVIVALLLALAGMSYGMGYRDGQLRDIEMREARGRLSISLSLYQSAEEGDLETLLSKIGMVVLAQTRAFEQQFGEPAGTDAFAEKFQRARSIAAKVESRVVTVGSE